MQFYFAIVLSCLLSVTLAYPQHIDEQNQDEQAGHYQEQAEQQGKKDEEKKGGSSEEDEGADYACQPFLGSEEGEKLWEKCKKEAGVQNEEEDAAEVACAAKCFLKGVGALANDDKWNADKAEEIVEKTAKAQKLQDAEIKTIKEALSSCQDDSGISEPHDADKCDVEGAFLECAVKKYKEYCPAD